MSFAAICTAVLFAQTPDPEAATRRNLDAGEAALKQGQLEQAEKNFLKIVAMMPQDLQAHVNLGVIYMRQKKWKRALEELRTAEKLTAQVPGIRFDIGLVFYRQGECHDAIAPFESVLRDQPDWTQARRLLGICCMADERFADASAALELLWPSLRRIR